MTSKQFGQVTKVFVYIQRAILTWNFDLYENVHENNSLQ